MSLPAGMRANDTAVSSSALCDHLATRVGAAVTLGKPREVTCLWLVQAVQSMMGLEPEVLAAGAEVAPADPFQSGALFLFWLCPCLLPYLLCVCGLRVSEMAGM